MIMSAQVSTTKSYDIEYTEHVARVTNTIVMHSMKKPKVPFSQLDAKAAGIVPSNITLRSQALGLLVRAKQSQQDRQAEVNNNLSKSESPPIAKPYNQFKKRQCLEKGPEERCTGKTKYKHMLEKKMRSFQCHSSSSQPQEEGCFRFSPDADLALAPRITRPTS